MSAVRKQGQRLWTAEQRLEQSRKLRDRQIWLTSTGPRTERGKSISRLNALTHGQTSRPVKDFMAHFKRYNSFLRLCWGKRLEIARIQKNELRDQKRKTGRKMVFSDQWGVSHYDMTFTFSATIPPPLDLKVK